MDEYVLCYFLTDNKKHWSAAKKFAKKHRLKLYIIPQQSESYIQDGMVLPEVGVEEFLGLISNAKYILTDSFHGTVFSLIFNRQFYVFERFKENEYSSQNARVLDLVESISLMDRVIEFNSTLIIEKTNIEYDSVNLKVNEMVEFSKQLLDKGMCYGKKM